MNILDLPFEYENDLKLFRICRLIRRGCHIAIVARPDTKEYDIWVYPHAHRRLGPPSQEYIDTLRENMSLLEAQCVLLEYLKKYP